MLATLIAYRYAVLIPLAIFEGPIVAVICGVGAANGYLDPIIAYVILVLGDLGPDLMWYSIGRYGANLPFFVRSRVRVQLLRDHFPTLQSMWHEHSVLTMLSVKLAYGFSPAFIVSAGLSRLPLKKFIIASLIISTLLLGALEILGYGFSAYYTILRDHAMNAELIVTLCAAAVFAALFYTTAYARSTLTSHAEPTKEATLIATKQS